MNTEFKQMEVDNVYEAVLCVPQGKPWVPSHMILVKQYYADGRLKKYKGRLVANGKKQDLFSYKETSSPTGKEASVKLLYAKAASLGRVIRTFDVKGAYLKSEIDQELYMLLPKKKATDANQWVRLLKSIYGLKQAGKLWFENIKSVLMAAGCKQSDQDECVFTMYDEHLGIDIDIVLYVDDILTSAVDARSGDYIWDRLRGAYGDVNETSDTETHLGIRWQQTSGGDITLGQPGYIDKVVKELNMQDCPTENKPTPSEYHLVKIIKTNKANQTHLHTEAATAELRKILGLVNHAAVHTRPDILYPVSELAVKVVDATNIEVELARHIVRYLKGTKSLGLRFKANVGTVIQVYIDASRDLKEDDVKGQTGISYRLGKQKSASFHFISKKQSLVTRSANEAEIFAVDFGIHEIEWMRQLLNFWRCPQPDPTEIYEDNLASIDMLAGNTKFGTKSRHIHWRYKYALQAIREKSVQMKWISTKEQIADILTKNIQFFNDFLYLRSLILNCKDSITGY